MNSYSPRHSEFICFASMGIVGVILALAHAFAAFSPVFKDDGFEMENRSFVAGPVTILELAWSGFLLLSARLATVRVGPAILAGLVAVVAALFLLLVAGGARNWMAATLLVFLLFWSGVLLELRLGFVHRRVAQATASSSADTDPHRRALPSAPWLLQDRIQEAIGTSRAVAARANAVQAPPPYEHRPSMPDEEEARRLLSPRETHGTFPKAVSRT